MNLLVVDDRPENRTAMRAILAAPDYTLVEAGSGAEALRVLIDREFAVMLVDIVMPEMDGFELATLVRARERTSGIPIVFVTAAATDTEMISKGYRSGGVDYLVKPLVPEIVRAKVAVFVELYRQRKVTEASLREKEVLLREVHHRVKNNLQVITSLLHMQGAAQAPPVRALFAESEARVRSIALVHENLYQADSLASIDLHSYFTSLLSGMRESFPSDAQMTVRVDPSVRVPMDVAIPLGLIVNELVSNALKHAFVDTRAGSITISLEEGPPRGFVLEARDNGVGIPPDFDIMRTATMGFQIVRSLVRQLNGTLERENPPGTVMRVRFPRQW